MSEERVKVIEAMVGAWNGRDVQAAIGLVDDDFEYVNPPNAVEPGTRRGADGITIVMTTQWEALGDDSHMEIDRTHHREDDVITELDLSRGMPGSTARIEVKAVLQWTFEGDRLIRMEVLGAGSTFAEALAEAGIA